jgi:hypothetical protein
LAVIERDPACPALAGETVARLTSIQGANRVKRRRPSRFEALRKSLWDRPLQKVAPDDDRLIDALWRCA